jgi:hypothetical protein
LADPSDYQRCGLAVLKLESQTVTIALTDYALFPIERLLGMLTWMLEKG